MKRTIIPILLLSTLTLAGCATQEPNSTAADELARYDALLEEAGSMDESSYGIADVSDRQAAVEEQKSLAGTSDDNSEAEAGTNDKESELIRDDEESKPSIDDNADLPLSNEQGDNEDVEEGLDNDTAQSSKEGAEDRIEPYDDNLSIYFESYDTEEQVLNWFNTADSTELTQVKGVTSEHAEHIKSQRTYRSILAVVESDNAINNDLLFNVLVHLGIAN